MNKILAAIAAILFTSPLWAQEWYLRQDDQVLGKSDLEAVTSGEPLEFYDDGVSRFETDGTYSYTYASGRAAFGQYRIEQDGTICVDFDNGFARCDRYVRNNGRLVLLTEDGQRFPIRP